MQIQRLQNLWLLIAFVAALVSLNYNWLDIAGSYVTIQNNIPLLILALLATILPLLSLCLYKNLRRQKLAGRLSALFALFTIGYVVALSFLGPNPEAEICILSPCLMGLSGILDCLAVRAIASDERLLRSADRIR
jgi:hypothetical protein